MLEPIGEGCYLSNKGKSINLWWLPVKSKEDIDQFVACCNDVKCRIFLGKIPGLYYIEEVTDPDGPNGELGGIKCYIRPFDRSGHVGQIIRTHHYFACQEDERDVYVAARERQKELE